MSDIYEGKPFLKLLDAYVLDAIGALDADSDAALTAQEPTFHALFGGTGDWRTIVVQRMQFPMAWRARSTRSGPRAAPGSSPHRATNPTRSSSCGTSSTASSRIDMIS